MTSVTLFLHRDVTELRSLIRLNSATLPIQSVSCTRMTGPYLCGYILLSTMIVKTTPILGKVWSISYGIQQAKLMQCGGMVITGFKSILPNRKQPNGGLTVWSTSEIVTDLTVSSLMLGKMTTSIRYGLFAIVFTFAIYTFFVTASSLRRCGK